MHNKLALPPTKPTSFVASIDRVGNKHNNALVQVRMAIQ
jgi:hypothetical protein